MNGSAADPFDYIRGWNQKRSAQGWWHSFELPDGTRIEGVCSLDGLKHRIRRFPIPADLRGKRVLDIGTWDGWFAFEMERRGADVVAIDNWDNPRFREMHARLGSRVDYRQLDVYELTPDRVGRFDIVLFMGVLYHLKHPLFALERVCALTTGMAAVDSFVLREEHLPEADVTHRPIMEFYETDEMGGQTDNWVGPSLECLLAFCRTAGFARVELEAVVEHSACVSCYRRWLPQPENAVAGPKLIEAVNNANGGMNFDSHKDEQATVWFHSESNAMDKKDVKPQVGDYGVQPLHLASIGLNKWQANFKLPPGLTVGWHPATVRVGDSAPSNSRLVAVDVPLRPGPVEIVGVRDGSTWAEDEIDLNRGTTLAIWVAGLPKNADRNNVQVFLNGRRAEVCYVEQLHDRQQRQVNVQVPDESASEESWIAVVVGAERSEPAAVRVRKSAIVDEPAATG